MAKMAPDNHVLGSMVGDGAEAGGSERRRAGGVFEWTGLTRVGSDVWLRVLV